MVQTAALPDAPALEGDDFCNLNVWFAHRSIPNCLEPVVPKKAGACSLETKRLCEPSWPSQSYGRGRQPICTVNQEY